MAAQSPHQQPPRGQPRPPSSNNLTQGHTPNASTSSSRQSTLTKFFLEKQASTDDAHQSTMTAQHSGVHQGTSIWACPPCPMPTGWTSVHTWAEEGYAQPVAVHVPYTWNIDALGSDICVKLPDPWSPDLTLTWCNEECITPNGPGRLWPACNPTGTKRCFAAKSAADSEGPKAQQRRRDT